MTTEHRPPRAYQLLLPDLPQSASSCWSRSSSGVAKGGSRNELFELRRQYDELMGRA